MNKRLSVKKEGLSLSMINLDFFEDLLAFLSPKYLDSIQLARQEYQNGDFLTHEQVFKL